MLILIIAIVAILVAGFAHTVIDSHVNNVMDIRAQERDALAAQSRIN
jgi:hypothetical protein